jgi:hypothetical protein
MRIFSCIVLICMILCIGIVLECTASAIEITEGICTATADCWDGTVVTCSGVSPCSYRDSSCPSVRGSVTCGGVTKYCETCPIEYCPMENKLCADDEECQSGGGMYCMLCFCLPEHPYEPATGYCICEY